MAIWIKLVNIFAPLIMLIIGYTILIDKTITYFLASIWFIFTVCPTIISELSGWELKEKDLFSYKYSTPLISSVIISSAFFLLTLDEKNSLVIISTLAIFAILYLVNHTYISQKYPEYYFKS